MRQLHALVRRAAVPRLWIALAALAWSATAGAQTLVEAAKKEGKVVIYGSLETGIMDAIEKAFTKKYGIPIEYFRAASNKTLDRVLTKARVGRTVSDVVVTNSGPMALLRTEKISPSTSPKARYPEDVTLRSASPIYRMVIVGILYNKLVKPGGPSPWRIC